MSKPIFPSRRYRGIGFTREEVAELREAFDGCDLTVQRDEVDTLKGLSSAKLKAHGTAVLARRAQRGHSDHEKPEPLENDSGGLSKPSSESEELTELTGEDTSPEE